MDSRDEELLFAVSKGDLSRVSFLLSEGANVNVICSSGRTALGSAAEVGDVTLLKMLLDSSGVNIPKFKDVHYCQKKLKGRKSRREAKTSMKPCMFDSDEDSDCDMPYKAIGFDLSHPKQEEDPTKKQGKGDGREKNNQGFFIVVHGDQKDENLNLDSPLLENLNVLNDLCTPDGMEKLEWDVEVEGSEDVDGCDDAYTSLYRWYADILDRTGSLLQPAKECDVNHQDTYGRSAVHYAAEHGHVEALALLASAGCKLDVADTDNFTPLHLAVARDHIPVVKMLLSAGAQVNRKTSDKASALHMAASRGHAAAARALLEAGAAVDALDAADRTPLLLAVARGHEAVARLLLRHGAKVNIEEIHGYTPLCEAVWKRAVPLVQLLLEADAKVTQSHFLLHDAVVHRQMEMVALLVRAGCIVNLRDDNGDTPLIVAARTGHAGVARLLLENGASVNYANSLTGSLPLHEAVEYIRPSHFDAFEDMFRLFVSYGAAIDEQTCTGGDTPLFRAVLLERVRAAGVLVRHGADVNRSGAMGGGVDVATLAIMRGNLSLVRLMVHAGCDLRRPLARPCARGARDANGANDPREALACDALGAWLDHLRRNAMPLADICRIAIRRLLNSNIYAKVEQLFLPVSLKKYLLLEDIPVDD